VSGRRLIIGAILMGVITPVTIFFLLGLSTFSQFFTIAASTFLAWGVGDLLASILEKPRLENRSARGAIGQEWERRAGGSDATESNRSSS
jgi:hypothetical protein